MTRMKKKQAKNRPDQDLALIRLKSQRKSIQAVVVGIDDQEPALDHVTPDRGHAETDVVIITAMITAMRIIIRRVANIDAQDQDHALIRLGDTNVNRIIDQEQDLRQGNFFRVIFTLIWQS